MARFTSDSPNINRNGAPTQQKQVEAWYAEHPDGSVSRCAKELGVSRPTARKWMPNPPARKIKNRRRAITRKTTTGQAEENLEHHKRIIFQLVKIFN